MRPIVGRTRDSIYPKFAVKLYCDKCARGSERVRSLTVREGSAARLRSADGMSALQWLIYRQRFLHQTLLLLRVYRVTTGGRTC